MPRWLPTLTLLAALALSPPASAQVVRDGSFGPPATGLPVPGGIDPTGQLVDYLISQDLGETQGSLLYHSFETFSVGTGEIASFTGSNTIDVIISRVPGAGGTFLNGVLRSTLPNAELFFLSPGGIVIGAGAQIEVPSSIHFGTADTVRFGPDPAFDLPTDSLARPTVLSSAPPSAFGFGPDPAPIAVGVVDPTDASRTLRVAPGAALSFVGGDVTFTGAPFPFQGTVIGSPGSTVQLASTRGNQDVPFVQTPDGTRLDLDQLPADALDGTVLLQGNARIDVGWPSGTTGAAGSVIVRAGNFSIVDGRIEARHQSDLNDAGIIDIGARDSILLDDARITSITAAAGDGPDVALSADRVTVQGAGSLLRVIAAGGDGGEFRIVADDISVLDRAAIETLNVRAGAGGAIRLQALTPDGAGRVRIEGGSLASEQRADGVGGAIGIQADQVIVGEAGEMLSFANGTDAATGGAIRVETTSLVVQDGSRLATVTGGPADGGALTVEGLGGTRADRVLVRNAPDQIDPARLSTNTTGTGADAGSGGALTIRTDELQLIDGGQLFARTEGAGDAGALRVEADQVEIRGVLANPANALDPFRSGITSRVNAAGAAGSSTLISIDTRILEILDGGQVSTATFGIGDAGDVQVTASERMTVQGGANGTSLVSAAAVAGPTTAGGGQGGLVSIETRRLELLEDGQVTTSTTGTGDPGQVGDAGDVIVTADSLLIRGGGIFSKSISRASQGVGNGGSITLRIAEDATVTDGGRIEVSGEGDGNAGDVLLDIEGDLFLDGGGRIQSSTADLTRGLAGSVTLDVTGDVVLAGGAEIRASTGFQSLGAGGIVRVTSGRDLRLTGGSRISSSSLGIGDAGDIEIDAQRVLASQGSAIETEASNASGGSILVDAAELFELVDASVTTSVEGQAATSDAGNIRIETPGFALVNRGTVVAQAIQGSGGRIDVVADNAFFSGDSVIDASSAAGPQGVVAATPPENALLSELTSLPVDFADPSGLLASDCATRTAREGSFTVATRRDAAEPPDLRLPARLGAPAPAGESCEPSPAADWEPQL